ncbi:MAG: condensation domain-containing protein, partial [Acidobacteria bacterium]|nr:condensation domain-containing protein [Acidobacteriota bacterium]
MNTKKFEEMAIASSQLLAERNYWQNQLGGEWEKVHFPYDFFGQSVGEEVRHENGKIGMAGETEPVPFTIADDPAARLLHLAGASDPRLHIILAAVVYILLYRYTGSRDIILGTTITRQPVQGEFINSILPLRNRLAPGTSFKELLIQSREIITRAYGHQNYPMETLLYELNLPFSQKDFPLFDVVVLLENIHDRAYLQPLEPPIIFSFRRAGQVVEAAIDYRPSLYRKDSIEKIKERFIRVLTQVLANPDIHLIDIDILAEGEREQLLIHFNDTAGSYPQEKTLHRWFEEQVRQSPDRAA